MTALASWPSIRDSVILTIAEPGRYRIEVSQPAPGPASLELQRFIPTTRAYTTVTNFDRDGAKTLPLAAGRYQFVVAGAPLGIAITVSPAELHQPPVS